jgi:hypothetical protein
LKCTVAPDAFTAIPNAWGQQGWTTATLSALSAAELRHALTTAYAHAVKKKAPKKAPRNAQRKTRR